MNNIQDRADIIMDDFSQFTDGYRMIMLTLRGKEGGKSNNPDRVAHKRITSRTDDFRRCLEDFITKQQHSLEPLRIYSSVNKRDIDKSIREFKFRQLEADYYDVESRNAFYRDIKNRWISSIMAPRCRAETQFLIDVDFNVEPIVENKMEIVRGKLIELNLQNITKIIHEYPTKNGYHFIVQPFNPMLWDISYGSINKDGMLLLSY